MKVMSWTLVPLLLLLAGCASLPSVTLDPTSIQIDPTTSELFDHQVARVGPTTYKHITVDEVAILEASSPQNGQGGASFLHTTLLTPVQDCIASWKWSAPITHSRANLRRKDADDVAGSVAFMFGRFGFDFHQTLRYAWVGGNHKVGDVIVNPYFDNVRTLVLQVGPGDMRQETRNLAEDFESVFGKSSELPITRVALMTDNDNTGEPVQFRYRSITLNCGQTRLAEAK